MGNSPATLLHELVIDMDRAANKILQEHFGISYKRAYFLLVLRFCGTTSQHDLAVALGYSDPAVSNMLIKLEREGYITTEPSPSHGRKRLVTLTSRGDEIVREGTILLDSRFEETMATAGVDKHLYEELTERLYKALHAKIKGKEIK